MNPLSRVAVLDRFHANSQPGPMLMSGRGREKGLTLTVQTEGSSSSSAPTLCGTLEHDLANIVELMVLGVSKNEFYMNS